MTARAVFPVAGLAAMTIMLPAFHPPFVIRSRDSHPVLIRLSRPAMRSSSAAMAFWAICFADESPCTAPPCRMPRMAVSASAIAVSGSSGVDLTAWMMAVAASRSFRSFTFSPMIPR